MPAVTFVNLSGDDYVDSLVGDLRWATNSFTYSFPTAASYYGAGYGDGEPSTNFGALTAIQQATVRTAMSMYASAAELTFAQITETSTRHADLRFAMSDKPDTAWGYFPTTSAEGGDAWFNKSSGSYSNPVTGNYAYLTFLHEIGHTLGLEHPHESGMPEDRDSAEYTVMSYRSYTGASTSTGYVNETWGFAQSLMMYDIAALQKLYGPNYTANSSTTVYSWSPATGEMFIGGIGQGTPGGNRILLTIWDGGGTDTYDLSNYGSNLTVDLRAGNWTTTSTTQLAKLRYDGSKVAVGNIANALLYQGDTRSLIENAAGGSGSDVITGNQAANALSGNAGNDKLTGNQGNDVLNGGAGSDTVVYSGNRTDYTITWHSDGSIEILDLRFGTPDGTDIVGNAEWYQFADKLYAAAELQPSTGDQTLNSTELTISETFTTPVIIDPVVIDPVITDPAVPAVLTADPAPVSLTLSGTRSADKLLGGAGNDSLYGGAGNDVLMGGAGRDYLNGGSGTDYASYASTTAAVEASLTSPSLNQGQAAGDRFASIEGLMGSAYADKLVGSGAANTMKGGAGNDNLYGQGGNDTLFGGAGNDNLTGGTGRDMLYGGTGADTFVFTAIGQSRGSSIDTIKDFVRGIDHIDLRKIDANAKLDGNQTFSFIGKSEFSGRAGQLKLTSGVVSGDVNGDKVADFHIKVTSLTTLSKGDFHL